MRYAVSAALAAWCLATLAGATFAGAAFAQAAPEIPRFSAATPGTLPAGWEHVMLSRAKKETQYSTVADEGTVVLKAVSRNTASLLAVKVDFDPRAFPMISWKWKVIQGNVNAETANRSKEDAPARVMVSFSGDLRKIGVLDRAASAVAESVSGQALPYAELMYVWGGKVAVDSVTTSSLTSRIRMLAVSVDEQGVGKWQSYTRNLVEDYKRAFGEEPGRVTAIKVMTDTDNTNGISETLYGDISVGSPK